ncbi:MAG: hypothetical protein WCJ35_26875 [Planctomycetota bacterium]
MPTNVLKTVDPEFYTYAGFRDWFRFPLVYPYSICCGDSLDAGCLCRHDGKSKISDGKDEQLQGLHFLTAFSFDAHFLVGTRNEAWPSSNGALTWVLVDFANGKIESFLSKDQLAAAAKARGYSGDLEFADVKTRFDQCFGQ